MSVNVNPLSGNSLIHFIYITHNAIPQQDFLF